MQLEVKTVLNRIQHFAGFVYQEVRLHTPRGKLRLEVRIEPHRGLRGRCSKCRRPAPGYDRLPERWWLFVPLWGIVTRFWYAPRRVECPEHGVVVEHIPWSEGKRPVTTAMMGFLARWARRLSWRETAQAFQTSWEAVYRSVEWFVRWGLAHRKLEGVESIGLDEIHWGKGMRAANFLTVIYQIDSHCRRLLWVGRRRTQATLRRGLAALGAEVVSGLRFVCSDMWQPYLKVIAAKAGHALHVLDRFHITLHLNQAVDKVRRAESGRLRGRRWPSGLRRCGGICCGGAAGCAATHGLSSTPCWPASWQRRGPGTSRNASSTFGITSPRLGREPFWTIGVGERSAAASSR